MLGKPLSLQQLPSRDATEIGLHTLFEVPGGQFTQLHAADLVHVGGCRVGLHASRLSIASVDTSWQDAVGCGMST
jgi:hypothetical protein